MNELDLHMLCKAETGFYPPDMKKGDYIEWLENKIYELTKVSL